MAVDRTASLAFAVLVAGLLSAPAGALAWGGSSLAWLEGTQPWDSTPFKEADVQVFGGGGDASRTAGLAVQTGLTDELQVSGLWRGSTDADFPSSQPDAELDLRLRESTAPEWRPAFSIYGRAPESGGVWTGWGGVAAEMDPWESSLAANAEMGDGGSWRLRLGLWTPYLAWALRLGAEASWHAAQAEQFTPQLAYNAPGDISLQAGLRFDAQGKAPLWVLRLSYQVFPNP